MKFSILLLWLVASVFGASVFGAERPNVLFIIVDDLTTTLGSYGDQAARTPNMDALVAAGVELTSFYVQ